MPSGYYIFVLAEFGDIPYLGTFQQDSPGSIITQAITTTKNVKAGKKIKTVVKIRHGCTRIRGLRFFRRGGWLNEEKTGTQAIVRKAAADSSSLQRSERHIQKTRRKEMTTTSTTRKRNQVFSFSYIHTHTNHQQYYGM